MMLIKNEVKFNLDALSFAITNKCNLSCSFCSRDSAKENEEHMRVEVVDDAIRQSLKFTKLKSVNLSGGEVFMHPDIENLLDRICKYGVDIRINTNGHFFNDENIKMLNKYNVKMFTVSMDSCDSVIHDEIRGIHGSLDKTKNGINRMSEEGYLFFLKMTVNALNVNTMFETMKFAEALGATGFSFSRVVPIGRARSDVVIDENFLKEYYYQGSLCSEYAKSTKMRFVIDDPLSHFFDVRFLEGVKKVSNLNKVWRGCTAGLSYMYILLNGDVLACTGLVKPMGNLNRESLENIWFKSELAQKLRTRKLLEGRCSTCDKKYLCGGCRAYAYATTGNEMDEDIFCQYGKDV